MIGDSETAETPRVEDVAEQIIREATPQAETPPEPKRGPGRPPGSKTRKPKAGGSKGKKTAAPPDDELRSPDDDVTVEEAAVLGATVWDLIGPFVRCRPLNADESYRLGSALRPVMMKYLPVLGEWQGELVLFLTIATLYKNARLPDEPNVIEIPENVIRPSAPAPDA